MDYILYHASIDSFDVFDKKFINSSETDALYNGFWFSSSKGTSPAWRNPNYLKTCIVTLNNPAPHNIINKVVKDIKNTVDYNGFDSLQDAVRIKLKTMGFDGVIFNDIPKIDKCELELKGYFEFTTPRGSIYKLQVDTEYNGIDLYSVNKFGRAECITGYEDLDDFLEQQEQTIVVFESKQIEIIKEEPVKW